MKNHGSSLLMVVLVACMILGISTRSAMAADEQQFRVNRPVMRESEAGQTPLPTQTDTPVLTETPEERILPAVGSNAGLVLGASVLVLIIIGGVMLFSRRKSKH